MTRYLALIRRIPAPESLADVHDEGSEPIYAPVQYHPRLVWLRRYRVTMKIELASFDAPSWGLTSASAGELSEIEPDALLPVLVGSSYYDAIFQIN